MSKFLNYNVSKKNLLNFLTPTSKGTKWYDPAPENLYNERVLGRFLLQYHQVAEIIKKSNLDKNLKFIDIGTGNGILPELISKSFKCKKVIGIDPYEDGEHKTSHPKGTRKKLLTEAIKYIKNGILDFNSYKKYLNHEGFSDEPQKIKLSKPGAKWKFIKKSVEQLSKQERFNFIFAKCIDHISNWENLIREISIRSEKGCIFVIKHNSYFSFNGAHRYASTFIPWGHVVLKEKDYLKYAKKYHADRFNKMKNFYFKDLSYPRNTIDDLKIILFDNGWKITKINFATHKNSNSMLKIAGGPKKLLKNAKKRFSNISLAELTSSRIIIQAEKD